MKSILDRSFRYTPSVETDLRKTFARIRRKQRETEVAHVREDHELEASGHNVLSLDLKKSSSASFTKSA
jgi:hypothetical protein